MAPQPVIVTIWDYRDYSRVLLYSYYTTITGWGVLLRDTVDGGTLAPAFIPSTPEIPVYWESKVVLDFSFHGRLAEDETVICWQSRLQIRRVQVRVKIDGTRCLMLGAVSLPHSRPPCERDSHNFA